MKLCKCQRGRDYVFNTHGADFYCRDCKVTHPMCCATFVSYICGKVENHEGPHTSINGRDWTNEVYGQK